MLQEKVTPEQIQKVLKTNGIQSLEDLSELLAEGQNSRPGTISKLDQLGKSWIIKVWELDKRLEDLEITNLPENLGGSILKNH